MRHFTEQSRKIALTEGWGRYRRTDAISDAVTSTAIVEKVKGLVVPVIKTGCLRGRHC